MHPRRTLVAAGLAAVGAAAARRHAWAQDSAGPLRIAVVGPMTGQLAALGSQFRAGAEQAVADLNAAGGVMGRKVALEVADDACDPRQAVSVANQLVGRGTVFVAGHACSGSSIPASKVYGEEGVLQISPATTNPDFTEKGGWQTFRVCGRDDQQGQVAGRYLADRFRDARIAVLHDNSAYGKGLAEETTRAMQSAGVKPALTSVYTPGERDYGALVSRLKAAQIGVIYVGGYHTEAALILRQAKEQGMNPILFGGDALVVQEFWQIAGTSGEGTLMTFTPDPRERPDAAPVVQRLRAAGREADGYVLYTYAAIQVWAEAAGKAGTVQPRKVAAMLKSGGPWQTVIGPQTFDAKGDLSQPSFSVHAWRGGKLVPVS
ncbi:MAG: branched-chain amino acid ABC transporter substrate-binding protein [Proteobacteria bacterium]|nr:branched-chain amino acid ABC transporter substrate-binding protein [Pseudomonadota bacterium]